MNDALALPPIDATPEQIAKKLFQKNSDRMQRTWCADIFKWDKSRPAIIQCPSACELYNQDCRNVYGNIDDGGIDLLLTDPPYGTTRNGWDTKEFRETLEETWSEWLRIVKPNGAIVVMSASPFDKILAMSRLDLYRYEWIWNKNKATGHLNSKKMPMKAHENILVFYQEPPTYNPQETLGHAPSNGVGAAKVDKTQKLRNYGHHDCLGNPGGKTTRKPRTILNIPVHNNDDGGKWHPTQKPAKLMEFFVRTYTKRGDRVLDPYMGSGTTGIAALHCGRKFTGIEIDKGYFVKAKKRLLP